MQIELNPSTNPARNNILQLNLRDKNALRALYMPFLRNGGIFIPTETPYKLGDEIYVLLTLTEENSRIPLQGQVVWITPKGMQGNRIEGVGIKFYETEAGQQARRTLETWLGALLSIRKPTRTI
ncbi:MAG: PilZ domain-containing protein [Neisseriaceae bacterium]|nr:PilZ domain-containing protein [Neisseriaceae bacterium]